MSFLQLISKNNSRCDNPAYSQLQNYKINNHPNLKSEHKEVPEDPQIPSKVHLKTRALSVNHKRGNKTAAGSFEPGQFEYHIEKRQSTTRGKQRGHPKSTNKNQECCKIQYHHSFSNYLAKKQISFRQPGVNAKIMHYDLEQIVNKISSPIKLGQKIDLPLQNNDCRLKNANLSSYHNFVLKMHSQRNRYQSTKQLSDPKSYMRKEKYSNITFNEKDAKIRPKTLWLKRISQKSSLQEDQIIPWQENEENNSPILRNGLYNGFKRQDQKEDEFLELLI